MRLFKHNYLVALQVFRRPGVGPPLLFPTTADFYRKEGRTMANPKRRHSHSRTRLRRAHDSLPKPHLGLCPKCGQRSAPHQVCGYCGTYRGVQIIRMEEVTEAEKK